MSKIFILFTISLFILSCSNSGNNRYQSSWDSSPDGTYVGSELWANRLQDWKVENGSLVCLNTRPMRTVHITTRRASESSGVINSHVILRSLGGGSELNSNSAAGVLIGAGNGLDYRASSLIHHSYGKLGGLFIGLDGNSNLFVRDFEHEDVYLKYNKDNNSSWDEAILIINIRPGGEFYRIKATAVNPSTNQLINTLEIDNVPPERITGSIALVSHSGYGNQISATFAFSEWQLSGSKLEYISENSIGPIIGVQYTLSRKTMKLSVQMVPLGNNENRTVRLELLNNDKWELHSTAEIADYSFTAHFRSENWNEQKDVPFRIIYELDRKHKQVFEEYGIIKHDPVGKENITLLSLSCIKQVIKPGKNLFGGIDRGYFPWDQALLYPSNQLLDNLKKFEADILFFAGDQIYEGGSPTSADTGPNAHLDYLYKWYLWCQTYKDLISTIPSIAIPDDHDVYHGNLWGAGGIATPNGLSGARAQDAGGYKMSPEFVNMVQTTQTSHLPDPYDPEPVEQGIDVYYTECNIGGVSFAILEDRKFKSAPRDLLPDAGIVNGWPLNPDWNAKARSRIEAILLGERQLNFLEEWSSDWSNATWMKAVLSQTLFANLATIPSDAMNDGIVPQMEIPDSGVYLDGDKIVSDFDSNGWPQNGRDRAIRLFRKAFATHIAGDQHLGSTVQYGIDNWGDANYAIISPATGNIWPRRWHPPIEGRNREDDWPPILGDFEDGFGNLITVHAVSNPQKSLVEPILHNELSTGYSVIKFSRDTRNIELANWPYYSGPGGGEPFPFWPVEINQLENYGRDVFAWLPELQIDGMVNPVVKIIREITGELIYSLRINGTSFQPWVFSYGNYRMEVGEPDSDTWQLLEGINATSFKERRPLEVKF